MENMEEKLGAILGNPEMMQQIMALANSLDNPSREDKQQAKPEVPSQTPPTASSPDLSLLQKLSGFSGQGGIDREEKQLLQALTPYLSRDRVQKLENAMRAAKMAKFASSFLGNGGLALLSGR